MAEMDVKWTTAPADTADDGEPEGGWVTSPQLVDTEVLALVLCRFTGTLVPTDGGCPVRAERRHPDVECRAVYFQGEALGNGVINLEVFDAMPNEVRQPWTGGDQIGVDRA